MIKERLVKKGWTEKEINKAEEILDKVERHHLHNSKIIFWNALFTVIVGNLLVSLILVPFLIVLKGWVLYSIVILLALIIGTIYNFLIMDIGYLKRKHHILAGIIVPFVALSNILVMTMLSNQYIKDVKANNEPHDIFIISIVFAVAFILPYLTDKMIKLVKKSRD